MQDDWDVQNIDGDFRWRTDAFSLFGRSHRVGLGCRRTLKRRLGRCAASACAFSGTYYAFAVG